MAINDNRWCILRTGGSRTLPLHDAMRKDGLDVWTPVGTSDKRRGKCRARVEVKVPIMPTFVFARAVMIPDLLVLSTAFDSPYPSFSIFRHEGRIALIGDRELAGLRTEESRADLARRRRQRRVFEKGQRVRVPDGPFAGLTGVVDEGGNGKFALVFFGEWPVQIATFLLESEQLDTAPSHLGAAARAA